MANISGFRRWMGLVLFVILFSIVVAFSAGRLQAYMVTSGSMLPTIHTGDRIIVHVQKPTVPHRGQVVAVRNPKDSTDNLCKRVVAVPGDRVEVRKGHLYLNGVLQDDENYVNTWYIPTQDFKITLGSDEFFVLGDNRDASVDSTEFGAVHSSDFIGVAVWIYWPPRHVGSLHAVPGVKAQAAALRKVVVQ